MSHAASDTHFTDLFRRWQLDRDQAARDELFKHCSPWLHAYVRPRLTSQLRAVVESGDVVNEALVCLLQFGPRFLPTHDGQLFALVGRIVMNRIKDIARGEHGRWGDRHLESSGVPPAPMRGDGHDSPDAQAEVAESRERLLLSIELLDDEDRRIVRWRSLHELEFTAIAEALGIEPGAARKRFERALIRLGRIQRHLHQGDLDALIAVDQHLPDSATG